MTMTTRLFALLGSALMLSFLAITTVEAGYRGGRMGGGFHGGGFHGARMHHGGFHRMAPRMMAPRMAYRPAMVHRGFNGGGYRMAHAPARVHFSHSYGRPMHHAYGGHPHMRAHFSHARPVMMRPVYAHAPRFAPARPMYRPAPHMMRPAVVHRMPAPSRFMGGHHMHQRMAMAGYKRHH